MYRGHQVYIGHSRRSFRSFFPSHTSNLESKAPPPRSAIALTSSITSHAPGERLTTLNPSVHSFISTTIQNLLSHHESSNSAPGEHPPFEMPPSLLDDFIPTALQTLLDEVKDLPYDDPIGEDILQFLALPGNSECNNKLALKEALRAFQIKWIQCKSSP